MLHIDKSSHQINQHDRTASNISLQSLSSQSASYHCRKVDIFEPSNTAVNIHEEPETSSMGSTLAQRSCAPSTSDCRPCRTDRLLEPEAAIPPESPIFTSAVEEKQVSRLQDFTIGGILIGLGVAEVLTGAFDHLYHVDNHEHGHDDDGHDAYEETVARRMRQVGHIFEGVCTTLSGTARAIGALLVSDRHYSKSKVASNTLQALGFFGTATAAAADWSHGHKSHAAAHSAQALLTLGMTVPDLFFWMKKSCTEEGADIALQENRKAISKKITIASNFADAMPSGFLAVSMSSPFYAIETALNLLMGWGNAVFYRVRKNGRPFIKIEFIENNSRDESDRDSKRSILVPKELKELIDELRRVYSDIGPIVENMGTNVNKDIREMLKLNRDLEGSIEKIKELLEQTTGEVVLSKPATKPTRFLKV